jgi:hypothetical protein
MSDKILGYCGLYCGGCPVYQGTKAGKPLLNEKGEGMFCDGCNSDRTTEWCTNCDIKNCAREKSLRTCIDCDENPCDILSKFISDEKYPYHTEVQKNMMQLKDLGLSGWIAKQTKRYTCNNCSASLNWNDKQCPQCKKEIVRKSEFN